jgi:hypothetical protein
MNDEARRQVQAASRTAMFIFVFFPTKPCNVEKDGKVGDRAGWTLLLLLLLRVTLFRCLDSQRTKPVIRTIRAKASNRSVTASSRHTARVYSYVRIVFITVVNFMNRTRRFTASTIPPKPHTP